MQLSLIDFEISSGSGPELPMQVVQPKPTRLNPTLSRSVCRPELERYSATTWLPGASEVFTQGFAFNPFSAALRASRPAPISTLGLEVLVQEVIAAITTSPWPRSKSRPSTAYTFEASASFLYSLFSAAANPSATAGSATRPSGRFGPAIDGTTSARSSVRVSVNTGSSVLAVRNMPCVLAYFSTSATRADARPEVFR